jgi:hypothetical protein
VPLLRSYQPLEVVRGELGSLASADMFALGASLLELATRAELPRGGQHYADLRAGRLPLLPTCTQRFAAMIRRVAAGGGGAAGRCACLSFLCAAARRACVGTPGPREGREP